MNDRSFGNVSNIDALAVSRSYRRTPGGGELRSLGVTTKSVPQPPFGIRLSRTRECVSNGAENRKPRAFLSHPGLEPRTIKMRRDAKGFRASRN